MLTKALASHAELPGGLHRGEGFTPLHGMVLSPTPQEKSRMTGPIAIGTGVGAALGSEEGRRGQGRS